jgi:hypothetical protein
VVADTLGGMVETKEARWGEPEEVEARIMRARVQRSSIVDSCGIGRSNPTAWCFVQAGLPFKANPINMDKCGRFQNRHFARKSSVLLSRTWV